MVSFTCQNCQDVIVKKKVNAHCTRCPGAWVFTCILCLKDFEGFEFEKHTSCISEEEKYAGIHAGKKKMNKSQENFDGDYRKLAFQILNQHPKKVLSWKDLQRAMTEKIGKEDSETANRCLASLEERWLSDTTPLVSLPQKNK
eukprot:GHVP01020736.1.p1 GENE.GHVP01020736.1~~GHVP01020736.1.p1  ORF type:complete len:143 (-),score=30.02 GHVP01020736.1:68-496(-)